MYHIIKGRREKKREGGESDKSRGGNKAEAKLLTGNTAVLTLLCGWYHGGQEYSLEN